MTVNKKRIIADARRAFNFFGEFYSPFLRSYYICKYRPQTCKCKKGSDWLKRWVEAQHNIFKL